MELGEHFRCPLVHPRRASWWVQNSRLEAGLGIDDLSTGTNSTNDWEEDYSQLALQIGRWYPSAMMLANGSILVMGGQRGANDIPVPSVEILPRIPGKFA